MKSLIYSLVFLFFFVGCKKNSTPDQDKQVQLYLPGVYFTDIEKVGYGQPSPVIMDKLIEMVDSAPENSHLYLSIFGFDHAGVISALERAAKRGTILHIMIDFSVDDTKKQNPGTISKIRGVINANSEVVVVTSDVNESSINHNKFVLFSELNTTDGKVQNVVFQTSHNFTVDDSKKVQDAVTLNDSGLYDAYKTYWNDIKTKAAAGMKDFNYREYNGNNLTAFFYPKRKNGVVYGDDTIIEILNSLDPTTATIRVGMSDWVKSRINVADKLSDLLDQGAKVEVVVKNKIDAEIQNVLNSMKSRGAFIKIYNISKTNIHSKFMLIEGKYKGEQCTLLITGSHNFTTNALRNNNETMLMMKNQKVLYDKYVSYYTELKKLPGI
ncbi:phospholipase D-like domain-containing protein [Pseudopedobacter beijingensis]|uniref:phospholipase D n=1 Tax=Pseudopedobacter beijingensis TaxID=1207056 RepID=A0ABW4ID95_9SPHI